MDANLKQILSENLLFYRQKMGLSQEALAEQIGISQSFYAKLESGKRLMSIDVLCKIADGLNVSIDNLLYSNADNDKIDNIVHMLRGKADSEIEAAEKLLSVLLKELENARLSDKMIEKK